MITDFGRLGNNLNREVSEINYNIQNAKIASIIEKV